MSGHVGDLSPEQTAILAEFREKVKDVLQEKHDDYFLLRWLRARNFDLKKSENMLREALLWRKRLSIDNILTDFEVPEVVQKYRTGGVVGRDKEGCPIYIDPYGLMDMKGLLRASKKMDVHKFFLYQIEELMQTCEKESLEKGKHIEQVTVIFDLEKLGFRHLYKPAVDVFLEMISCFESAYPEILKKSFVINAPRIFPIAYNLIKPLLSEATAKKVKILGCRYKDELLKHISSDQLPVCYGGTMTDNHGDPRCKHSISQGGTIPKDCYRQTSQDESSMTCASIGRGSTLQIDFNITVPNSILKWEFQTEQFDIGFGVYKRTEEGRQKAGEMQEIVATHRTNSHLVPEDGLIQCKHPGTYVLRFDNTFSWSRGKKVLYNIDILAPEDAVEGHVEEKEENDADVFYNAEEEVQEDQN